MSQSNVPVTPGSGGASVATDVVSSLMYQQIKVVDGTLGSTNGLVVDSSGNAHVTIIGSVATVGSFNGSVSGTVGASIVGTVPVTQSGIQITSLVSTVPSSVIIGASIFGLPPVNVTNFPTTQNVSGSVMAVIQGSIAAAIVSGSVAVATGNSSVQVLNFPTNQNVSGSVVAFQGTSPFIVTGSVQGTFAAAANQSVSGTVGASLIGTAPVTQAGTWIASVFGNVSVLGTVPVTESGTWIASTGSDKFAMVDEATMDNSDYIYTNTVGAVQRMTLNANSEANESANTRSMVPAFRSSRSVA